MTLKMLFSSDEFVIAVKKVPLQVISFDGKFYLCHIEINESKNLHNLFHAGIECGLRMGQNFYTKTINNETY